MNIHVCILLCRYDGGAGAPYQSTAMSLTQTGMETERLVQNDYLTGTAWQWIVPHSLPTLLTALLRWQSHDPSPMSCDCNSSLSLVIIVIPDTVWGKGSTLPGPSQGLSLSLPSSTWPSPTPTTPCPCSSNTSSSLSPPTTPPLSPLPLQSQGSAEVIRPASCGWSHSMERWQRFPPVSSTF